MHQRALGGGALACRTGAVAELKHHQVPARQTQLRADVAGQAGVVDPREAHLKRKESGLFGRGGGDSKVGGLFGRGRGRGKGGLLLIVRQLCK